jgi:hypothetical protein
MEASRRQPAYESGHARGGSHQATTASRREQEASRRKSTSNNSKLEACLRLEARNATLEDFPVFSPHDVMFLINCQVHLLVSSLLLQSCRVTVTEPQDRQRLLRDRTVVDLCINLVFKVHL